MTPQEQDEQDTARRALSALTWDDEHGDRHNSLVVLVHAANPSEIDRTLHWALLTDEELQLRSRWHSWPDPFGEFHSDPCESSGSPYAESDVFGEGFEEGTE